MPDPMRRPPQPGAGRLLRAAVTAALLLAGCDVLPSPTAGDGEPTASPSPAPSATAAGSPPVAASPAPTATPEPALSLELPSEQDSRAVAVTVEPAIPADAGGELVVTVANLSSERVTELVLRWPTALRETLFIAPFAPSEQRVAEGGPPLVQEWTKWVEGPGEGGEPAGTTSLGWGPLDPGATLRIPLVVTRNAPGEVAFDLQVLAGEAVLSLEDGGPAELRVEVP